ncbi:MAG: molybdopterin molybdotransferase MoeA [Bacteroidales bacterium]
MNLLPLFNKAYNMIDFKDALQILVDNTIPEFTETSDNYTEIIPIEDSVNRILAMDIVSYSEIPPFNRAAMDGYACKREDIDKGKYLKIQEIIPAGKLGEKEVIMGVCSKIMTGASLPTGAEVIVMVEECEEIEIKGEKYMILSSDCTNIENLRKKENYSKKGEDLQKGDIVIKKFKRLRTQDVATMASCGYREIRVNRKVKVAVISTGDEICEPFTDKEQSSIKNIPNEKSANQIVLPIGKIFNANSWQIMALLKQFSAEPTYYGIAVDDMEKTKKLLKKAVSENKLVLISGGVSEGDFDYVPIVMKKLGFEILFDRVAVQPGKPTTFAVRKVNERKYLIGLPGNPVSTYVQTNLFVKALLSVLNGLGYEDKTYDFALARDYHRRNAKRLAHIPIVLTADGRVIPIEYHGSAHISAIPKADGFARIPIGVKEYKENDQVQVILL